MKTFLEKLKKLFTPMAASAIAAGLISILVYFIFARDENRNSSIVFVLVLFVCLLALGFMASYLLADRLTDKSFIDNAKDPTFALLTGLDQPVLICTGSGEIKWINRTFYEACGSKDLSGQNTSMYFQAQPAVLCEKKKEGVEAEMGGRKYIVQGYTMKINEESVYVTIWQDETEYVELQEQFKNDKALLAYVVIDNLDEILRFAEGNYRTVASQIDEVMEQWAKENKGVLKEYDKDKYLFLFHAASLQKMEEEKFDILDRIREIRVGDNGIPVTISIGIGNVPGNMEERSAASVSALETALQRGGDQAVVKYEKETAVFGGKTKTVQKKTKIRARVVATELTDMICSADNVLIMGHKYADFDAFGACIGIAHFCTMSGVRFNIVCNPADQNLKKCFEKALAIPGVDKNTFIDGATALDRLRSETLLIIVDVNNPAQFESEELAKNAAKTVCIDHHRKTGEFAVQPIISYIDPSASSACELLADMLEQSIPAGTLCKDEADLMLAGIVLDTKKYEINTGTKTFGAAQYLKSEGADTGDVQQLFITNFDDYRREAGFGGKVTVYGGKYAIAVNEDTDEDPANRIAAAKAADRMLSIEGIEATFALCTIGETVRVSGRSNGKINVQLIMERMGGGGRYDAAAAELKDTPLTNALFDLKAAIDGYEKELKESREEDKEKDKEKKGEQG